jgi:ABC-2 type transport system permease protein
LLKARTTRLLYGLTAGLLAGVAVAVVISVVQADHRGDLATASGVRGAVTSAGQGLVLILVFGIISITGEFRHNTVIPTLMVMPSRFHLFAVKVIAAALISAAFGLVASLAALAISVLMLRAHHVDLTLVGHEAPLVFVGVLAATVLYGILGVAIGSLIRNQTLAVVLAFAWLLLVENLLIGLAPGVARWLPAGAALGLMRSIPDHGTFLAMPAAGALLTSYVALAAVAGAASMMRRDVA